MRISRQSISRAFKSQCKSQRTMQVLAASVALLGVMGLSTRGDTFTYTNATGTAEWSGGVHWSSSPNPPTSGSTTTLAFSGGLVSGNVEVSDNDLPGNFLLNQMTVQSSGPTTGTAPTILISGNPLEFVNDTTDPLNPIAPGLAFNVTVGNRTPVVTVSSNLVLTDNLTLSNSTAEIPTISGVISSTGGLTMAGTGTIALTNSASTYAGMTTFNSGILRVGAVANVNTASSIGTGTGSAGDIVFGGGALQYSGSTAASTDRLFTIGNSNGNTAALDASGTSAGTFNWTNTGAVAFGTTGAHTMTFGGTYTTASTFAPLISDQDATTGKTSVSKTGTGAWILSNANTYSGGTTISGGTLESTTSEGFGTGLVTVTAGQAWGAGSTYSNDWNLAGTIRVGAATLSGKITLSGNSQITNEVSGTAVVSGQITGTGAMSFLSGTSGSTVTVQLTNPANDWKGDTMILSGGTSGGTHSLQLGADNVIPNGANAGNVILSGTSGEGGHASRLVLNGFSETINGLYSLPRAGANIDNTLSVINGAATGSTLTVGDNDASGNLIGTVSDGGAGQLNLVKIGTGTQVLAGRSSYTGTTVVNGGTLKLDFNQFSATLTNAASNYFPTGSDLTLNGATFAIQGRGNGGVISQSGVAFGRYDAFITLTDQNAALLVPGQELVFSSDGTDTTGYNTGFFVSTIDNIAGANSIVNLTGRAGKGGNQTGFVTTSASTGTTSQTLKSLTLSGATGENATIDFGTSGQVLLTISAAPVQVNDGSTLTIANWDGIAGEGGGTNQLVFSGLPTDFSSVFSQDEIIFAGYGPGYELIDGGGTYEVVAAGTAVPEPMSLAILGLGAAGLLAGQRRRC